jgi:four helix bundle protein
MPTLFTRRRTWARKAQLESDEAWRNCAAHRQLALHRPAAIDVYLLLSSQKEWNYMGASFKELVVWQRAVEMTTLIYALTAGYPSSEKFGLTNQLRRAAVSVASNIAEGYGRSTRGEYLQFLGHARGSNCEVETQLVIAASLGFGVVPEARRAEQLCADVSRLLNSLMKALRAQPTRP